MVSLHGELFVLSINLTLRLELRFKSSDTIKQQEMKLIYFMFQLHHISLNTQRLHHQTELWTGRSLEAATVLSCT